MKVAPSGRPARLLQGLITAGPGGVGFVRVLVGWQLSQMVQKFYGRTLKVKPKATMLGLTLIALGAVTALCLNSFDQSLKSLTNDIELGSSPPQDLRAVEPNLEFNDI